MQQLVCRDGGEKTVLAVYLSRFAPSGRRAMRHALDSIAKMLTNGACDAETLAWHQLRYQHTTIIRSSLAERYKPSTANLNLSAMRGILEECWRMGLMLAEDYLRAVDIRRVKPDHGRPGHHIGDAEKGRLFLSLGDTSEMRATRDVAVLGLLIGCGLRRSEIAALDLADYGRSQGAVKVRSGKGRKYREIGIPIEVLGALDRWIDVRGLADGALFCPINKGGRLEVRRMSGTAIYQICIMAARRAGIPDFNPLDCRRTFVGDSLSAGVDAFVVQELMGHASPTTTALYDRRCDERKRGAADKMHLPIQ